MKNMIVLAFTLCFFGGVSYADNKAAPANVPVKTTEATKPAAATDASKAPAKDKKSHHSKKIQKGN